MPTTPGGIPYQMMFSDYQEAWVRDANHIVAVLKVAGIDAADFRNELVGYTEYTPGATKLTRTLPFLCPYTLNMYCQSCDLVKKGFRPPPRGEVALPMSDPFWDDWLNFDDDRAWVKYQCVFARPPYNTILSDASISPGDPAVAVAKEFDRYCVVSYRMLPREQKFGNYQFETDAGTAIPEASFRPVYNLMYTVNWCQIPVEAIPVNAIARAMGTANSGTFSFRVSETQRHDWDTGRVLFRGPQDEIIPYSGASNKLFVDLKYQFEVRGGPKPGEVGMGDPGANWNTQLQQDGTYIPVRVRGTAMSPQRPYFTTDFAKLFVPGNT